MLWLWCVNSATKPEEEEKKKASWLGGEWPKTRLEARGDWRWPGYLIWISELNHPIRVSGPVGGGTQDQVYCRKAMGNCLLLDNQKRDLSYLVDLAKTLKEAGEIWTTVHHASRKRSFAASWSPLFDFKGLRLLKRLLKCSFFEGVACCISVFFCIFYFFFLTFKKSRCTPTPLPMRLSFF